MGLILCPSYETRYPTVISLLCRKHFSRILLHNAIRCLVILIVLIIYQVFKFLDGRSHRAHLLKRNPRKVTWTVLYRRKHRKGIEEETSKKRTKRTQKFQRAVVGATLQDIMAKRNQKPEVRKAQREQAIR